QRDGRASSTSNGDVSTTPAIGEITGACGDQIVLGLTLGDVHRHGQSALVGESRGTVVKRVRNGVWRMRRDAKCDQVVLQLYEIVDSIFQVIHRNLNLRWIGTENFLVHHTADAELVHRLHYNAAGAGVGVRCHAGLESFDDAEARRVEKLGGIQNFVAAATQLVDPGGEL